MRRMRRTHATLLAAALAAGFATGCDRPDEESCREAVENIQRVARAGDRLDRADTEAAVRSCRANASSKSIQCMINARTMEDLRACEGDVTEQVAGQPDEGS